MTYYKDARARAKERLRSPWTIPVLILGFVLMGIISVVFCKAVWVVFSIRHPGVGLSEIGRTFRSLAMFAPLWFASIPLGLLAANRIAAAISPIKKSLDKVGNYAEAQKEMWALGKWIVFGAMVISVISALI